jgi:thiol-disulfide isomerase/thioredoxin
MRRSRPPGPAHPPGGREGLAIPGTLLWNCLAPVCLGLGLTCMGCSPSGLSSGDVPTATAQRPPSSQEQEVPAARQPISQSPIAQKKPATAEDVLKSMVAAYQKASSYADAGKIRLRIDQGEGKVDETADFSVTLVRPNKLRMQVYQAMVVCDGRQLHAAIQDLPGQVLVKQAPEKLTMESVYADRILASVLTSGLTGPAPQLILLLEDDPLGFVLHNAEATSLTSPGTIAGRECYRVEIKRDYGTSVLWIDRESYALRRIVFPTDELRKELSREGPVGSLSLVAEFTGAELGGKVDAKAFQFETPAGAELVKFFAPPDPAQLLAKQVPEFHFVDLKGKPVTPGSLAGKITVLEFWSTSCEPCRLSLSSLEKVRQQYAANQKISFYAVSVDGPDVKNEAIEQSLKDLGVQVPILRDPEQNMLRLFRSQGTPTRFIIDAKRIVQYAEMGVNPAVADPAAALSEMLKRLLAGNDVYQEPLEAYRERLKQYERRLKAAGDAESSAAGGVKELEIPRAEIAQHSQPKTLKLSRIWRCTELTAPGNIFPIKPAQGPPRLLVVDAGRSVAEVGLDGKLIAAHPLSIDETELVTTLRTATGSDGRRYVAVLASAQQRFHLLDPQWKLVFSYPQDALENRHSGIADVQLGDLDGDGRPEAYVGYWGLVGVQAVSLEGKRLWSNRSLSNVERMAIGGPDAQGRRHLLCTTNRDALAVLDSSGRRGPDVTVPGRLLHWIVAADLTGDTQPELCALAAPTLGENVAIGLNLKGEQLWTYPLPKGVYQLPIEPVVAGRLLPGTAGQWLLSGADGSIHVIAADGKLLDRFNYGSVLAGLATAELNGKPLLLVSTADALEAWKVE